jgi:hypothetical protein
MQHTLHYYHGITIGVLLNGKVNAVVICIGTETINAAAFTLHDTKTRIGRLALQAPFIYLEGEEELELLHGGNGGYFGRTDFIESYLLHGMSLGD